MSARDDTVYLFGAGATRGGLESFHVQPPPLDVDFFDIVSLLDELGTYKLSKSVLKDVWELYGKTSGISLEKYYRDIETRALIGSFTKSVGKQKDWTGRKDDLKELIRRAVIHTTCDLSDSPAKPRKSEVHKQILGALKSGDSLITFNYDMLIEESFGKTKLWSPIDGYGEKVHNVRSTWCRRWLKQRGGPKTKSKVLLLKLHGSINWTLYNNRKIRIKPGPYVLRTRSGKAVFDKISILPPGLNKPIHQNPYKELWRIARLKLDSCKNIVILGYSLPDADLLARALFAEVCRLREVNRKYLTRFHVVDPNKHTQEKMIDIFSPALGPDSHVFRYESMQDFVRHL